VEVAQQRPTDFGCQFVAVALMGRSSHAKGRGLEFSINNHEMREGEFL
jgi:hypothetical protein